MGAVFAVGLLFAGAYVDSRAVIYASTIWADERFHLQPAVLSGLFFTLGFIGYVGSIRFLAVLGYDTPTLQILASIVVTTALTVIMSDGLANLSVGQIIAGVAVLAGVVYISLTVG